MKTILIHTSRRFAIAFALTAAGVCGQLLASLEAAPSTPEDTADFISMDIKADAAMKGSNLRISLQNGIAVIEGTALTLDQTERATAHALATVNIRAVVNDVGIAQPSDPALSLRQSAEAALKNQDLVDASHIKINETNGRIVLTGTVGTWDEQELARELVSRVPAVRAIDNRLKVTYEGIRTDDQIAAQVKYMIHDDPLYAGLDVGVIAKDGVVSLSGTVGNKAEADRLVRRSYVTGVIEVNAANVEVDSDLTMQGLTDKHVTPEQTLAALKDAYTIDPRVDETRIQATLKEGVLTLSGVVKDANEKDAAESTARGVPGVLTISNQLEIRNYREVARNDQN